MAKEKITYKVLEANEKEPLFSKVQVTGRVHEFRPIDVIASHEKVRKAITELEAQASIDKAAVENIEHHHPFVKDWSDEDLHAAHLYYEHKTTFATCEDKLAELKEALADSEADVVEIEKQTGIIFNEAQDGDQENNHENDTEAEKESDSELKED